MISFATHCRVQLSAHGEALGNRPLGGSSGASPTADALRQYPLGTLREH
ncbi:hypothetical protein [Scytonema sp. PCC 10023]